MSIVSPSDGYRASGVVGFAGVIGVGVVGF